MSSRTFFDFAYAISSGMFTSGTGDENPRTLRWAAEVKRLHVARHPVANTNPSLIRPAHLGREINVFLVRRRRAARLHILCLGSESRVDARPPSVPRARARLDRNVLQPARRRERGDQIRTRKSAAVRPKINTRGDSRAGQPTPPAHCRPRASRGRLSRQNVPVPVSDMPAQSAHQTPQWRNNPPGFDQQRQHAVIRFARLAARNGAQLLFRILILCAGRFFARPATVIIRKAKLGRIHSSE